MSTFSFEDANKAPAPAAGVDTEQKKGFSFEEAGGEPPARGFGGAARDLAGVAINTAIGVPEAAVGVADMVTNLGATALGFESPQIGKRVEDAGIRFREAKEFVNENIKSDASRDNRRKFQEAEGIGGKFKVAIENPSLIAEGIGESLGAMGAGGVVARGALAAARAGYLGKAAAAGAETAKGAAIAGAVGEGTMMAGSQAEAIRQETKDGLLTPGQAGAALATGGIGGAFGFMGGRLANKLGIGDADTMMAQGTKGIAKQNADEAAAAAANPLAQQAAKGIPRQVVEGAISEGFLEELPQSMAETIIKNLALDKPWTEGLDEAIVMGVLSGGAMGGAAAGYKGMTAPTANKQDPNAPAPTADAGAPAGEPQAPAGPGTQRMRNAFAEQLAAERAAGTPAPVLDEDVMLQNGIAPQASINQDQIGKWLSEPQRPSEAMGLRADAGGLKGAAALAVDSGASPAVQPQQYIDPADLPGASSGAPYMSAQPAIQSFDYLSASPEDRARYDALIDAEAEEWENMRTTAPMEAFATLDALDESNLQSFDQASNVTNEEFLRSMGASDEEINDAIATTNQPRGAQGSAGGASQTQANDTGSTGARAVQGQAAGQVAQPQAQAQPQVQPQAPVAGAQAQQPPVKKAPSVAVLAAISRKQIPDMTDAELAQLANATARSHSRYPKLQKAIETRGLQDQAAAQQGAKANGTQTPQAQQSSAQPTQAGAAVSQAVNSVPAASAAQAAGPVAGQGAVDKTRWIQATLDKSRLNGPTGVQIDVAPNGGIVFKGDPNSSKDARALKANYDEAIKAGATPAEIADALLAERQAKAQKPSAPAPTGVQQPPSRTTNVVQAAQTSPAGAKPAARLSAWDEAAQDDNAAALGRVQALVDSGRMSLDEANATVERAIRASTIAGDKGIVADYLGEAVARKTGAAYDYASTIDQFDGLDGMSLKDARAEHAKRMAARDAQTNAPAIEAAAEPAQAQQAQAAAEKEEKGAAQGSKGLVPVAQGGLAKRAPKIHLTSVEDLTAALGSIARKLPVEVKGTEIRQGGRAIVAMPDTPTSIDPVIAELGKALREAMAREGVTLPSNPADMTRDQFAIAYELSGIIPQFELTSVDLNDGLLGSPGGMLTVDVDKLYDKIQAEAKAKALPTPSTANPQEGAQPDEPTVVEVQAEQTGKSAPAADQFANNKIFTADKVAAARARMKSKLGQLNSGIDPELLVDGMTIAGAYIEDGMRKFSDFAKAMVDDMGDGVKPYLLSFWEGARNYPGLDNKGMTSSDAAAREFAELNKPVIEAAKASDEVLQAAKQAGIKATEGVFQWTAKQGTQARVKAAIMDSLYRDLPDSEIAGAGVLVAEIYDQVLQMGDSAAAIGQVEPKPAKRSRKTGKNSDMTLTQDWGVEHIDGYGDDPSRETGNSTKDAFLKEAKSYLREVSLLMQDAGFVAPVLGNGKPATIVSVNESGAAGSGDVSLTMRHADTGTNVYVHLGDTSLRGVIPSTPSGIAVMARTSQSQGDTYASKGQNRWMPVDLSASDLAALLLKDARATMEAQSRTTETKEVNNGNPEQAGRAADQGRAPEVSERGGRDNDSAAPADSGDLESRQSGNVPAPADTGRAGSDGIRVSAADVGRAGPADKGGNAGNGRTRASGARTPDAGAGKQPSVKAPEEVSPANPGPGNFHLDNPLEIVGGTPVARFDKNMAAIELLNQLRESERQATAEEQRTLAGYTGWGSFGQELFQGTWAKPMPKQGWEKRDQWLREHLGQDEWESAQRSITNAHYTDPPTVMAMWDMVKRMGFGGGRVLEPSMGIGNFFGMMPADIKGRSQLAGIELDSLTGAMAKRLYPDANIKIMGYQESKTPDNFHDVVIGNWPFENTVIADRRYNTLSPFLHDYFFLKALDQVRPGGLVVGITSNGTMDKKATRIRAALARKAELVTSIRLPSGAFQEYAGTKVVTDIVILKKRDKALSLTPNEPWINSVAVKTPAGPEVFINEFYAKNPGNVIGTTDYGHGTTRVQPGMIVHRPENMAERLREAVNLVPEGVFSKEDRTEHISYVTNHTADREGSLSEQNGQLYVVRGEHLAPAQEVRKYALKSEAATAKREQELRALIDMRRKYAALIEAERDGNADDARKALRQAYEGFNKAHGALNDSFGLDYLRKIDDPFYPALAALTVNGKPSDILSKSTMRGARAMENPTAQDAYVLARNKSVEPTLAEIAAIAGKPEDEVRAELVKTGAVYEAPNGDVVPSDIYLSGNVRQKLREAQAALDDGNKAMERNVAELKKVIPEDVPYFNIESQLGATWVPAKAYAEYVAHMLNRPNADGIEATFLNGRWKIRLPDGANHWTEARTGFGTEKYPFSKLVNAAFTNQTVKIRRKDSEGNEYVDTGATDEANARIGDIRTKFAEWLWSDPERRAALEAEYNESRNSYATPKFDGSFLHMDGMALSLGRGPFNLRQHQVNAIWRALVNRRSLNAHEVGTGKTFTMGGIAVESRRYGIAKKPVLLAHNANSASVAAEIQMMYPAAKVLYIDNLDKNSIAVRMRQIANDDWDTIVMPHSLIDRLSFREETLMEMAREDIRSLEEEAYAAAEEDGVQLTAKMMDDDEELKKVRSITAKELVKARNRIIETVKKQAMQSSREGAIPFEDLGIDMVLVDEVHEFKKPPISTRMNMKGLNTQTSNRSIALQFITRYIRANNFGGNVHTFTGTPITNTLTEIFHQMRYVMEDEMKAAGVESWDGWFGSFAKEVQDVELSAAGEYEAINRLAGFINVPELRRMIGQYMDVVFADDMPEMQPRKVNGKTLTSADLTEAERAELLNGRTENAADRPYKKVVNVTSDLTAEQSSIFSELQGYARRWRNMAGKERKEAMYKGAPESPIITEGLANKASFDVRLMQDEAYAGQEGMVPDDPGSKASKVVANVLDIYRSDDRAAQVVFAEQGFSTSKDKSMGRDPSGKKITRRAKTFSTMRDIVERLVQGGIPREQIAIVDGGTSKEKRKEIADAMNTLAVRVVIGSTDTLGVGVNMQRNLRAMHHMDAPYMPGELEQRNGRGLRQGNQWNTVMEYRYMTDRLDGRRWQILAIKQRFITAFMKANSDNRVIEGDAASDEESDIVQSFSEAAGDPRILIRAKLRKNVEALQRSERMHGNGVADARRNMRNAKEAIEWNRGMLRQMTANELPQRLRAMMLAQSENFTATVQGKTFDARKDAEEAIELFLRSEMRMEQSGVKVGTYRDQTITARWPSLSSTPELVMEVDGQEFSSGSLRGLEQQVRNYPGRIGKIEGVIADREASIERLDQVSRAPFSRAADLENAVKRLEALEKDIEVNPVPPPAWLRAGAPVDSEAFRAGQPFVVTGHRWTQEGWFVLGQDAKGEMAIPYTEVMDAQGMPLYEEREFQAPEVIEKEDKSTTKADAPANDADVRFSRVANAPGQSMAAAQVQQVVDAMRAAWANGPEVVVAFDMQDPAIPAEVRAADLRQRSGGAVGEPEGFYYKGKAYVIAGQMRSANDVARVVAHEVLGHAGLRGLYGKDLGRILDQLATMRRALVNAKIKEYGLKDDAKGRREAAEEVLANMAETTPHLGFVTRAVAAIRTWLRANVPGFQSLRVSDAEIIRDYILPARAWVERGGPNGNGPRGGQRIEPVMSRGKNASMANTSGVAGDTSGSPASDTTKGPADGYSRLFHGGSAGLTEIEEIGPFNRFDGIFASSRQESASSHGDGSMYFMDVANDKILAQRDIDYEIEYEKSMDALREAMPWLDEDDVEIAYEAVVEDKSHKVDGDDLMRVFGGDSVGEASWEAQKYRGKFAAALGYQAVEMDDEHGTSYLVLPGVKVNPLNESTASDSTDAPQFSRSKMAELKDKGLQMAHTYMSHPGKASLWDKTVGTMRHLAERSPAFKPVFEAAQQFIDDVATVANEAAQAAPRLIPRVEGLGDMVGKARKKPISVVDNKAIGKALFGGNLDWGRDQHGKAMPLDELKAKYAGLTVDQKAEVLLAAGKVQPQLMAAMRGKQLEQFESFINNRFDSTILKAGVAFSHKELRDFFGMNDQQISLYDEARATVDKSLDMTARAEMLRALGRDWDGFRDMVMDAPTLTDAWKLLDDELEQRAKAIPDSRDQMAAKMFQIRASHDKARELMDSGYMPLQRFGKYTVWARDKDGETIYYSMHESKAESNRMAETMRREYPDATVTQGTVNEDKYKLFAGITPETAELFGTMLGLDAAGNDAKDQAFQEFLKLSKNNHSALKRLIHRKGIAGYSEDVGRVLASFVYSNARLSATGLNAGKMEAAINNLNTNHKQEGELGEIAAKLRDYIQDPQEEGQAIRGMLFAQYLGGSIASAMVNMTQPFAVTIPWLSQYGGMAKASTYMSAAMRDMGKKGLNKGFAYDADLAHALKMAEDEGIVSPQEIHQMMAQARGVGGLSIGDGTKAGDARATAKNRWENLKVLWGQPFALAEQFNRRSTFIAAFRLAKEQGKTNPAEFARRAVVETQFLYTKANKPQWARGAIGGTLFTFKTYSVSFLELMQRTWNAGEAGSPERAAGRRAVGWAMLMLMLMGGAGGLPFVEDVEDLVDGAGQMMGYNTSVKQWRQQAMRDVLGAELADFLESGLSGLPGMPLDVSGRLGMGNLIPGTGLLLDKQSNARDVVELLGPAGDLVQRGLAGTKEIIKGAINADGAQMVRGAGQWAPNAVRNLAKGADMAVSGIYKDSKGYKVIDTTLDEAILKAIGFQPRSVAEVQESNSFMQRSKSFYIQTSSDIKAKWAQALFEKDAVGVERARERVQEWNRKNPDQPIRINMPDIWKRVAQMGKDRTDRIADTAPKALRQQLRDMAQEQSR